MVLAELRLGMLCFTRSNHSLMRSVHSDVTKKEDLDKLYKEISAKEKYLTLLSMFSRSRVYLLA